MQCMDGRAWMLKLLEFPMQRAPTHVWIFTACLRCSHSAGVGLFSLNEPNITWKCWAPDLSTAAHAEAVRVRMYPLRKLLLRHFNLKKRGRGGPLKKHLAGDRTKHQSVFKLHAGLRAPAAVLVTSKFLLFSAKSSLFPCWFENLYPCSPLGVFQKPCRVRERDHTGKVLIGNPFEKNKPHFSDTFKVGPLYFISDRQRSRHRASNWLNLQRRS